MSKILVVFGATGTQGSSIINTVLSDPELSQQYQIRAITRDITSEKAKQLKEKVEVVQADMTDRASLSKALTGAHMVFIMTTPSFGPNAFDAEFNTARTIADVAVEQNLEYIIFSTLPGVKDISAGKYTAVIPFDAKAAAEKYIRSLPIKSAFFAGGFFMENFHTQPFIGPKQGPDGTWVLARPSSPETKVPYFYAAKDTGKFIGAILARPEEYKGKTIHAAEKLYSLKEIAEVLSRASGKTVVYNEVSAEEFRSSLPFMADLFVDGFLFNEKYGYFGPGTEELVVEGAESVRGELTSFEGFFKENPLQLV
jgi:uncharacterized protein YbjT (DUF2867 family)